MILHPAILALFVASLLTCLLLCHACWHGGRILLKWDIRSGSEPQLSLERRTYLVSTILVYALAFQLLSLFLFIFTADRLHPLFSGAMCAAGTLNVNRFGYPLLLMKMVNFMLAGLWLIINHADTRAHDYPLVRVKYAFLLVIAPLVLLELFLQFGYFSRLRADVITSCCGSLFSLDRPGFGGDLASLPPFPAAAAFYGCMAATFAAGLRYCLTGRGCIPFSLLSGLTLPVAVAALISFFCLYFYELPTHHCPFCILQDEYGHAGYILYVALLCGGVTGIGTGLLTPLARPGSMSRVIPPLQRRLAAITLACYLVFTLVVTWRVFSSSFRLG